MPGRDFPVLDSGLQPIVIERTITLLSDVLFARPDHFDGTCDVLRYAGGLADTVDLESPAKAAPNEVVIDRDFGGVNAEHLRRHALRESRYLRSDPDLAAPIMHMNRAIHRLHGGVREEGELEGCFKYRPAVLELPERIPLLLRANPGAC